MSKRHHLAERISSYNEVETILSAMKSVAMIELHKLSGQMERHRAVMGTVRDTVSDFLTFHRIHMQTGRSVTIVVGSERGFCGEFNEELSAHVEAAGRRGDRVLLIGSRLSDRIGDESGKIDMLTGANMAEEIQPVLVSVTGWLEGEQKASPGFPLHVTAVFHDGDGIAQRTVAPLPMPDVPAGDESKAIPPLLNQSPEAFLPALMDQALLLALQEVFVLSLAGENRRRLEHMDNALRRLREMESDLKRQMNRARQEDIILEIENIVSNAEGLANGNSM